MARKKKKTYLDYAGDGWHWFWGFGGVVDWLDENWQIIVFLPAIVSVLTLAFPFFVLGKIKERKV